MALTQIALTHLTTRNMTRVYVAVFAARTTGHSAAELGPELSGLVYAETQWGVETNVVDASVGRTKLTNSIKRELQSLLRLLRTFAPILFCTRGRGGRRMLTS